MVRNDQKIARKSQHPQFGKRADLATWQRGPGSPALDPEFRARFVSVRKTFWGLKTPKATRP
jgi:hypothetical protein